MKKLLILLMLTISLAISAQTTPSYKNVKLTTVPIGTKNDSIVLWNGTDKLLKHLPVSQIKVPTNLDATASPTGVTVFSSTGNDAVLPLVNDTNAGLQSPSNKTKLDGIASGATANQTDAYLLNRTNHTGSQEVSTISGLSALLSAKESTITSGTTAQYWRGDKTWQVIDKTSIGLGNVDNTSDINKPVSTATQTAINNVGAKQPYTAYINTVTGNNSTGVLGDSSHPYLTDGGAYSALPTNDGNAWNFVFTDDAVTRTLSSTSYSRKIKYICYNTGTINFSNFTISGNYNELYFDAPLCTLYHAGTTDYTNITTGSSNNTYIRVKTFWIEDTFLLSTGNDLSDKFLIGTFYQRSSGNAFFTSGTIKIGLFDSTAGNMVSNGTTIDITIDELSLNNNSHAIGLASGKLIANPIKKFSGTGTFTTSSINNFDVTDLETSSGTTITLSPSTWLKGKTGTAFLATIKGSPEYASNLINFNGRFTPASGADAYGASVNIINSNVILAGSLISSNSGWPSRTVVIKNSTFLQDTSQALFQGYGGANVLTIEKHGKLYSNGTLGVDGVNVILVNKTPNDL